MPAAQPRIAIIGGGLAGLICARMLQHAGITVTVYETEASPTARPQGGTLDIHGDSGQIALDLAGLTEEFKRWSRPEASTTKMFDGASGELLYAGIPGGEGWNPEMDRGELRRMLLNSLAPNTVQWDHKVQQITTNDDSTHTLHFTNGTTVAADLVIGADGTWSKVRPLLTKRKPRYTGITLIEGRIENWQQTDPTSHELIHPGSAFAVAKGGVLMVHSGHDAWVAAGLRLPATWSKHVDWQNVAAAKQQVLKKLTGWDDGITRLLEKSTSPLVTRPMYTLPARTRWQHRQGLTMIGDAAHVMPIFAGGGANLALLDGALLGQAIAADPDNWDRAVAAAERELFKRTFKPVLLANLALNQYFGPKSTKRVAYTFTTVQDGTRARIKRLSNLATSTLYTIGMYTVLAHLLEVFSAAGDMGL